jgi:hypothetical protein
MNTFAVVYGFKSFQISFPLKSFNADKSGASGRER